jgi:hypothetical protein
MSFFHPTLSFHPFFFQSTTIIVVSVSLRFYKVKFSQKKTENLNKKNQEEFEGSGLSHSGVNISIFSCIR